MFIESRRSLPIFDELTFPQSTFVLVFFIHLGVNWASFFSLARLKFVFFSLQVANFFLSFGMVFKRFHKSFPRSPAFWYVVRKAFVWFLAFFPRTLPDLFFSFLFPVVLTPLLCREQFPFPGKRWIFPTFSGFVALGCIFSFFLFFFACRRHPSFGVPPNS